MRQLTDDLRHQWPLRKDNIRVGNSEASSLTAANSFLHFPLNSAWNYIIPFVSIQTPV